MKRVGLAIAPTGPGVVLGQSSNDLEVDASGNLRLVFDAEAVGQHARQRLMFFAREWFLDPTVGTDWFGPILGQREAIIPIAEATVKRVILATPGVASIRAIETEFDRTNRGAQVRRCEVLTEYDEPATV